MRPYLIAVALLIMAVSADAAGQVYKWIDEQGRVHYTQTPPPPGARGVQRKRFVSSPGESSDFSYATRLAAENFPVTLYTSPDCGSPCDRARAHLVKRTIPFREVNIVSDAQAGEMKRLTGRESVPTLLVGAQMLGGYHSGNYEEALEAAGYPESAPPLPLDSLRKLEAAPAAPAPGQTQNSRGGETAQSVLGPEMYHRSKSGRIGTVF